MVDVRTSDSPVRAGHIHDGYDSIPLLDGFTLTGAKGGNAAVASIVEALVKLGATDATT